MCILIDNCGLDLLFYYNEIINKCQRIYKSLNSPVNRTLFGGTFIRWHINEIHYND